VSMDLDSSGAPHVAYSAAGVIYASWNGSSWMTQTVSPERPYNDLSLDIVGTDRPHIVYPGSSAVFMPTLMAATG
jgi:hypothetical protein